MATFPYYANKTNSLSIDREEYFSEPYSGPKKSLVRGSYKRSWGLQFLARTQVEFDVVEAFWKAHGRTYAFRYMDTRYFPAREYIVQFASALREQGSEVTLRFNYAFDIIEADEGATALPLSSEGEILTFEGDILYDL